MAGNFTIDDIAVVSNAVFQQALGDSAASIDYKDFVTCADITLKSGNYDPFNTALAQVLSRTIFSIRPYNAKFTSLIKDDIKWGNHVRKVQAVEHDPVSYDGSLYDANGLLIEDTAARNGGPGQTVDQYEINAPEALQTNFYGQQSYQKSMTVWVDQINTALSGPQEFGNFLSMVMTHASDQLEQTREALRRGALANLIGGTVVNSSLTTGQVRHLLTEYNTATGLTLTATTVMQPANFKPFMQWAYAAIMAASRKLTERTLRYHFNPISGDSNSVYRVKNIARHTPVEKQHLYILDDFALQSETMAIADVFNSQYMTRMQYETVSYWQTIDTPMSIVGNVNALTGGVVTAVGVTGSASAVAPDAVSETAVIGVLFDDEAVGVNMTRRHATVTPLNAKGLYTNYYWTETSRWWNDNTENVVVFLLD